MQNHSYGDRQALGAGAGVLSIIVPTLNEERSLEGTLRGIRQLRGIPHELIVADSGSTDATIAIARRIADRVVSYDGFPKNVARGRNLGASLARGEFLVFIDADVTVVQIEQFFRHALKEFRHDPLLAAITMDIEIKLAVRTHADRISYDLVNAATYVFNNVLHFGLGSGELQLIRASAFHRIGGYNERLQLSEDIELYGRLEKIGKVRKLPGLLVEHPGRRPHAIGWPTLWRQWILNTLAVRLTGRTWDNEWAPVR